MEKVQTKPKAFKDLNNSMKMLEAIQQHPAEPENWYGDVAKEKDKKDGTN